MRRSPLFLNASEAAGQLGVSTKALRLYEQRGLVTPARTAAGYRTYSPQTMARAAEIVALRGLGLSLAQVSRVLEGDPQSLETALAAHEAALEGDIRRLVNTIDKVRGLRADLARGQPPADGELARLLNRPTDLSVSFDHRVVDGAMGARFLETLAALVEEPAGLIA